MGRGAFAGAAQLSEPDAGGASRSDRVGTPTAGGQPAGSVWIVGDPGDRFVTGDWGLVDGTDTPGLFRPSNTTFYFRHTNTQGVADSQFAFGIPTWLPVSGVFGID